jgi:hypothetical protein
MHCISSCYVQRCYENMREKVDLDLSTLFLSIFILNALCTGFILSIVNVSE